MNLIIDPEFKNLIPPLKSEEFKGLKESILQSYDETCPITIWNGIIIDGHHRYKICKENNIEFTVVEKHFNNRYEVKNWMILHQTNQRSLSDNQRAYLIGKLYKEEKNEQARPKIDTKVATLTTLPTINRKTEEKIAEQSNVSPKTVRNNEKYAEAVDTIVSNTGISPFQLITGDMKASREEIKELAAKPVEKQKEIIERVEKKETNIKKELKKIKEEEKEVIPEPVHVTDVNLAIECIKRQFEPKNDPVENYLEEQFEEHIKETKPEINLEELLKEQKEQEHQEWKAIYEREQEESKTKFCNPL
jgi:hypothetical protein